MRTIFLLLYFGYTQCSELDEKTATISPPRHGIDFIGPLWLPRTYKITCCRGGHPKAENGDLISNWTQTVSDYAVDERAGDDQDEHCRVFEGSFLLSASALFNFSFSGYGVQCRCPERAVPLDRHCRKLPPCQNNGYRSQSLGMRCACTEPHFGEFCEKICDQGQILKAIDSRSYCSCLPFYQGEECSDMVCLNGGVEVHGRCNCPPTFVGYHCEIDGNRTAHPGSRFQRFGESNELFSRDISGTVFSLVMIIVLVVSMYLLMKHRMQVQTRFAASRREEMARAAAVYGISRRGDTVSPEDLRIAPFIAAGIDGPPPYMSQAGRGRPRNEILPPLPSYEDATKDLPIRQSHQTEGHFPTRSSSFTDEPSSSSEPSENPNGSRSSTHQILNNTTLNQSISNTISNNFEDRLMQIPKLDRTITTRRSL